jgi:hypothetical protein
MLSFPTWLCILVSSSLHLSSTSWGRTFPWLNVWKHALFGWRPGLGALAQAGASSPKALEIERQGAMPSLGKIPRSGTKQPLDVAGKDADTFDCWLWEMYLLAFHLLLQLLVKHSTSSARQIRCYPEHLFFLWVAGVCDLSKLLMDVWMLGQWRQKQQNVVFRLTHMSQQVSIE